MILTSKNKSKSVNSFKNSRNSSLMIKTVANKFKSRHKSDVETIHLADFNINVGKFTYKKPYNSKHFSQYLNKTCNQWRDKAYFKKEI